MSRSAGQGVPICFRCWRCRRRGGRGGTIDRVRILGSRNTHARHGAVRVTDLEYQYECLDCGHVGWSRHVDLDQAFGFKRGDK